MLFERFNYCSIILICFIGIWTMTDSQKNEKLLLHDNVASSERILIFATNNSLSYLADDTWFVDGNFDLAPKFFTQLYVIRVKKHNFSVTAAFCLLQRKTQSIYESLFQILIEECAHRRIYLDPKTVHMDFETASINAVKNVFGAHVNVRGCFYHLAQSTFRKLQSLGFKRKYMEEEQFSKFCGMIDSLSFLPLQDVFNGMSYLKRIALEEEQKLLLDYFDSTYVTGTYKVLPHHPSSNTYRLRRIPPLFPPEIWNVHESTVHDLERTNNDTEGWNHRFKNLVGHSHPSIYLLIRKIRQEVAVDETKVQQALSGQCHVKRKRAKYEKLQAILKNLCLQYAAGQKSVEDFLKAIGHSIRFS